MKIAVCSKEKKSNGLLDDRFGRSENFVIVDMKTKKITIIENESKDDASGVGGKVVKVLDDYGVNIVIAPELGPKAVKAVKAFDIEVYGYGDSKTVEEAIDNYISGKLEKIATASVGEKAGLYKA